MQLGFLMAFTFSKVYPRVSGRLEIVWFFFVKYVKCWLHAVV